MKDGIAAGGHAEKVSEVNNCLERLDKEIVRMDQVAVKVISRLESVLRTEVSSIEDKKTTEENLVPLADRIRAMAQRISGITEVYESLLGRIEL